MAAILMSHKERRMRVGMGKEITDSSKKRARQDSEDRPRDHRDDRKKQKQNHEMIEPGGTCFSEGVTLASNTNTSLSDHTQDSAGNTGSSFPSSMVDSDSPHGKGTPQSKPYILTQHSASKADSAEQILDAGSGGGGLTVHVHLDESAGEYAVKIKRSNSTTATDKHKINMEETKQLAESAGMLFVQADVLRQLGEQLLIKYRDSIQRAIRKPATACNFN